MRFPLLCLLGLSVTTRVVARSVDDLEPFGFGAAPHESLSPEAARGLAVILDGGDYRYGLPAALLPRLARDFDFGPENVWRVLGFTPSPSWRTLPDPAAPISLQQSYFLSDDAWVINQNCFACHSGVVAGKIVAGLGNAHVDAVSFKAQAEELVDTWDRPLRRFFLRWILDDQEMTALSGYVEYLRTLVLPSIEATSKGDIHGPWVVWRFIARMRDPARSFALYSSAETAPLESVLDQQLPTVRPNPWWRLKYKTRAFWNADVSPYSYATFALNAMDDHPDDTATFPDRLARMKDQLAFARQTVPPPYPRRDAVDRDRAARGRALFHGEAALATGGRLPCAGCHGSYDADGQLRSFPNRPPVPLATIGTDPAYARLLQRDMTPLYRHFAASPYAPRGEDAVHQPETAGYAPQPLVGIWASGPFFHNGSVPTVTQVLSSTTRPRYWEKSLDVDAYDDAGLGVAHTVISQREFMLRQSLATDSGSVLSGASLAFRAIYSTDDFGKANTGHTFGDAMNDEERRAVVEYLRLF